MAERLWNVCRVFEIKCEENDDGPVTLELAALGRLLVQSLRIATQLVREYQRQLLTRLGAADPTSCCA